MTPAALSGWEGRTGHHRETSIDVLNGGNDLLDGEEHCSVVNNDGDKQRACWAEEGPSEVAGVVEDGDPPCAVRHEDNVEGLMIAVFCWC